MNYGILINSERYIHMNLKRELNRKKLMLFSIQHNIKISRAFFAVIIVNLFCINGLKD